jgi:hypothetical protein
MNFLVVGVRTNRYNTVDYALHNTWSKHGKEKETEEFVNILFHGHLIFRIRLLGANNNFAGILGGAFYGHDEKAATKGRRRMSEVRQRNW